MEEQVKTNAKEDKNIHKKISKTKKWVVLIFLALVLIVTYVNYRGEYLEILELGENYLSIFWQNTTNYLITFVVNFIVIYLLIRITNKRIKKGLIPFFEKEKKTMPKMPNKSIAFIGAIIVSFVISGTVLEKFMLCINATNFGVTDVVLGYDIGYFIFVQPLIQYVLYYIVYAIVGLTAYAVLYYIAVFNLCFEGVDREVLSKGTLLKQLCTNIMFAAIFIAMIIFVETQNVGLQKILTLQNGEEPYVLWGAGISEVTIKLWGYRILSVLVIISIAMGIHYLKKKLTKKTIISLAIVPTYLIAMLIVLVGFNTIFVNPNELDKQQNYIKANIDATKQAYGIDIEEVNLSGNETITSEIIQQNKNVIDNIALINKDIVLKNLNIVQTSKGYYTYNSVHPATYNVNGEQTLVYVAPREISNSSSTYNHKTYEYTHGYGTIITSATSTDKTGNIEYLQKDFNSNEVVKISQPRIYFGLETNYTAVTNSNKVEFDYPITSSTKAENAENVYDGQAGLSLNFFDRLILAIKENDLQLAFSNKVNSESKILINRNIIKRAKTLMPYVSYDENPYLVTTNEGKLVWVIDGYTTSECYPYSQKLTLEDGIINKKQINYIRNSVKVLVDAYDGTVKFYITDRNDPIIMAYQKMYKDLFVDKDETIPEDISKQFIYPEYLYKIQAEIMKRYHNIQTDVLYRGDDIWEIATRNTTKLLNKSGIEIDPYYTIVKTVDNENTTLGLVLPYTPYNKQNLTSYLVGSYENGQAKLSLYRYPSDSNVLGTIQLDTQIEQDETISKELETLNITGTKIIRDMVVVPINNTLLYVEPIYQQYMNEENSTPILKKVIVASGNKVAIGNDITEALKNLVSQSAVDIEVEDTETIEGLIQAIVKANNNLKQSNSNNNWEMAGKDMTRLQALITKLEKLQKQNQKVQSSNPVENFTNQENNE